MKKLFIPIALFALTACGSIVANEMQVFLSREKHPDYEVAFFPDSQIHPSMFKITPKQRANQIMDEKCPDGYLVGEKRTGQQFMAQIDSTVTYRYVNFRCKE